MQLTLERDDLVNALSRLAGVIERKHTVLILTHVLLTAEADGLRLTGTDQDIEISHFIPATVSRPGRLTVHAAMLSDIVRQLRSGADVALIHEGGKDKRLSIQSGQARLTLPVLDAGDFPAMTAPDGGAVFTLLRSDLKRLIGKTRHAMSDEATRHYLNGGFLHHVSEDGADFVRVAATDGKVLASVDMPAPEGAVGMSGVIVPRKTCDLMLKLFDGAGDPVEVTVAKGKVRAKSGAAIITSRVIDGSFPSYGQVIPAGKGKTVARLKASDLGPALNTVAAISLDKERAVKFTFDDGGIALSTHNEQGGTATDDVAGEIEGPAMITGFNSAFVRDLLSLAGTESMTWHLFEATGPARIHIDDDPNALYILMPLRV